jgi:ribosome recycling factor
LLIEKISFLNENMDIVEDIISSISEDMRKLTRDEAIELLEKTLREKLKKW